MTNYGRTIALQVYSMQKAGIRRNAGVSSRFAVTYCDPMPQSDCSLFACRLSQIKKLADGNFKRAGPPPTPVNALQAASLLENAALQSNRDTHRFLSSPTPALCLAEGTE